MFVTRQIIIIILFIFSIWSSFCGCDQDLETRARYIQLMGILKPLNTRDRLTTRLNYIGANLKSTKNLILYSSITSNEECVLKRFDQVEERCEELDRQVCKQELVLKYKPVKEDCTVYDEYCYTTYSNVSINVDTVVCKTVNKIDCLKDEENEIPENICHRNSVAICSKTPKLVTVTLKKQPCGSDFKPTVTKMCVTHPDGKWACQDTMGDHFCFDKNVTKVISTEVTTSEMECEEKELEPICHDSNCKLESQEQVCVKDQVPTTLELKEIVCDICEHGRTLERPSLEEIEICRPKTTKVCANVPIKSHWKKWCRDVALGQGQQKSVLAAIKN